MEASLLTDIRQLAGEAGFNLVGAVATEAFDRCQPCDRRARQLFPDCGTLLVLGTGGRDFWHRMVAENGAPRVPTPGYHPIDDYAARRVEDLMRFLTEAGHACHAVFPDDPRTLNFTQLAEMAGLGTVSPVIGLLLHPEYGPWVSLRAVLLLPGSSPADPLPDCGPANPFQPCLACHKPCVQACPVHVHDGQGGVDLQSCALHRHGGQCDAGCDVRRACPIGAEHRYGRDEEIHRHTYSLFSMRRYFGLGAWRFMPKGMRGNVR